MRLISIKLPGSVRPHVTGRLNVVIAMARVIRGPAKDRDAPNFSTMAILGAAVVAMIAIVFMGEQFNADGEKQSALKLEGQDHYKVLGVDKQADTKAIKKSYRKLALKWHPDKNPDCNDCKDKMGAISKAYEILSDPKKRLNFDDKRSQVQAIGSDTVTLTKENWKELVVESEDVWLIQIYADFAYTCQIFSKTWEQTANGPFKGAVKMGRIDYHADRDWVHSLVSFDEVPFLFSWHRGTIKAGREGAQAVTQSR